MGFAFVAFLAVLADRPKAAAVRAGRFSPSCCLALTPPFYGHAFFNSKDIPFAALYALAVAGILACDEWPGTSWGRVLGAGALIGLVAAVRVGGLVLFGFALVLWLATLLLQGDAGKPARPSRGDLLRLVAAWGAAVVVGWTVMVAFWPWAMLDPLRHPFRAAGRFSRFWAEMLIFYDGQLLPADRSLALLPPELVRPHPARALPRGWRVGPRRPRPPLLRARPLGPDVRRRLLQAGWLASIPTLVVAGVVVDRMPLYDGLRHFLFLVPLLAVLAGVSVSAFLRSPAGRRGKVAGLAVLTAACLVTLVDMVRLHPYESVYFNRLVAGGMKAGIDRYEGDYWCLSYKEGCEWLLRRFAGARCREPIRVAGYSILHQTQQLPGADRGGAAALPGGPARGREPALRDGDDAVPGPPEGPGEARLHRRARGGEAPLSLRGTRPGLRRTRSAGGPRAVTPPTRRAPRRSSAPAGT